MHVAVVVDVLREWRAHAGRAPRPEERLPIAREQERRLDTAVAQGYAVVIADTSALMIAIHSDMLLEDGRLHRFAMRRQRRYGLSLLTGLDLQWQPDGAHRSGQHMRDSQDTLLRTSLERAGVGWSVVYGQGTARLRSALAALAPHLPAAAADLAGVQDEPAPSWNCERCSDPDCERQLFSRLLPPPAQPAIAPSRSQAAGHRAR